MKTLMLILVLTLTAQAQKTIYDKLTDTTEVTSERLPSLCSCQTK